MIASAMGDNGHEHSGHSKRTPAARIAFVTNFCPHYRVKTFELLARYLDIDFFFYSDGSEWYWQRRHGTRRGQFRHEYLSGFDLLGTRVTPSLPARLWQAKHDAVIKCIDGRFALAATYLTTRLRRRPFVLWTGVWSTMETPFHRLAAPLTRYIYRHADAIVAYGDHVKRYLVGLGVPDGNIFVAPHAVDNEAYSRPVPVAEVRQLREKFRLESKDRVILYFGRLEASKGLQYLLEAFILVAGTTVLVIAGDGSQRQALERTAIELGLKDRVRFAGYVPPDEALPYYAMAEALVLPSVSTKNGKEPWGLVVNEAMNQGVPVIATEVVGAAAGGLVQNGENGFIVPERDPAALADAMHEILHSPRLRKKLSDNARSVISHWGNEQMVLGFQRALDHAMHNGDPLLTS